MGFPVTAGLLEACVLGVVNKGDTYGYDLTQRIQSTAEISESTLYPVLRRLLKEQLLDTYDRSFDGRNRRYYRINEQGKKQFLEYIAQWEVFKNNVDGLLGETDLAGKE